MPNELDVFNGINVEKRVPEYDKITDYCRYYMGLCHEYKNDIEYIYNKLETLRRERLEFIEVKIPEIKEKLRQQHISEDSINDWANKIFDDTMRSLDISESLLNAFYVKKLDEFKKSLEDNLHKEGISI